MITTLLDREHTADDHRQSAEYRQWLDQKTQLSGSHGFAPTLIPDFLFDFQRNLVEWAVRKGRAAIFADCGLGKTPMQLVWGQNIVEQTGGNVLILTPLAVSFQTEREARKFSIDAAVSRDGTVHRGITITNYERLHYFNAADFSGVICDESSILKNYAGVTRMEITNFMRSVPYRLLCTATAAPNDYIELGTSSEALGVMERKHMLSRFFTHDSGDTSTWRLKGHAREHYFWRWVCSWARACRKPSDIGFQDGAFHLPPLELHEHVVTANTPRAGCLFDIAAIGLDEQREDLRRTLTERSKMVAELVNAHDRPAVCWTNLNAEADLLAGMIRGGVNVQGSDTDEEKERAFRGFADGSVRVIISKPRIAGFGLNWQHCAHETFFPSHSYEQFYQCTRRCWRFGQKHAVTVDIITTEGQQNVLQNMERKSEASARMFDQLVSLMRNELQIAPVTNQTTREEIPSWLSVNN